ncbi:hypothetical protein OIV83_001884 [Microbotryomycetes sp. JL201]|nr:hypothetical protein OIV83_001884 [Microbotryomycetes sp. JL201]
MSAAVHDHSRAIIASLFSPPPGTNAQPSESFIAYVQTFEDVPGQAQKKARFLILAGELVLGSFVASRRSSSACDTPTAARDGRLKLHKAKQNSNGTFSIGKTWPLEEMRSVEVIKKPVEGMSSPQPLEFVLGFNGKSYRYETTMPTSQQAAFLVTTPHTTGRGQSDLALIGFAVDAPPSGTESRSVTPSSGYTAGQRAPTGDVRPPVSQARAEPSRQGNIAPPPRSEQRSLPSQAPQTSYLGTQSGSAPTSQDPRSREPVKPNAKLSRASTELPYASTNLPSNRPAQFSQSSSRTTPAANGAEPQNGLGIGLVRPTNEESIGPKDTRSSRKPVKERERIHRDKRRDRSREGSATSLTTGADAAAAAAASRSGAGTPQPRKNNLSAEDAIDDDTVLTNVEEMLEGFEWRGGTGAGSNLGKADEIEKRLVGELKALEAAAIYAIMESDDGVSSVLKSLEVALGELDKLDTMVNVYKTQLSIMTDDIAHIEGQNRGLQVQTSNQRVLLAEIDNLMSTIHIPEADLVALSQESLESQQGVERLEKAVVSVYKALLSTRDRDMAAANEHVAEYRAKAAQFAKRTFDFLTVMFKFQIDQVLNPKEGSRSKSSLPSHSKLEDFLGRYCGIMLFIKEMDRGFYQQICATYFKAMGDLYKQEISDLLLHLRGQIRKATDEELEASFTVKESPTLRQQSMRRAGTLVRGPGEKDSKREKDSKLLGSDAFARALQQIVPHVIREQTFVSDFLNVNPPETSVTFADYMALETFFRRGAMKGLIEQPSKLNDIKAAMEVIFSWLDNEIKDFIDQVLLRDSIQIVGILAALDRCMLRCEEEKNDFMRRVLQKQHQRSVGILERACKDQIKGIEQTKLTLKKRKGVVPFVRVFPMFVNRIEAQLEGCDDLSIRNTVNDNYERIIATIFDCLQQMAKMDGEAQGGEGKDQLNYHVILIENMHHIISVFAKQRVPVLAAFVSQARERYQQNLESYIRLILRRPLSRVLDYFAGLESLLRTTPPTEVSLHSAYTKTALRRVLSDLRAKDVRKAVDALYKRVDKHFNDQSVSDSAVVLKTVWSACDEEMQRLTGVWRGLIEKCYPDDKVGLDFDQAQVHDFFVKARAGY